MAESISSKFEAVFFDLFNTLLHFDFSRLPEVEFQGQKFHTTTVAVHRQLREHFSVDCSYSQFLASFRESRKIVADMIAEDYREVSCLERLRIAALHSGIEEDGAAELMVQVHMEEMFGMMYCPDETRRVMESVQDYPLVLVSNFDHAQTARRALRQFGLEELFQGIFISDEVGWRKPGERLFQAALKENAYTPERCLYVGDDPCADAWGAGRMGFQVAWLAGASTEPPRLEPGWVIQSLVEVVDIIS